jgi:hypothetical protein
MDEQEKKVDSEWKEQVEQQKQAAPEPEKAGQLPEADFSFFITSLAMQASIALGTIANPVSQKAEENLEHARLIIDTLGMLREKTRGNLSTDEDSLIENYLYELRMQYLAKNKEKGELK